MAEYIDKRELIEFIKDTRLRLPYDSKDFHTRDIMLLNFEQYVTLMSAADVAEVKHGKWLLETQPNGKPYCYHCSVCDDDFHYIGITMVSDYCPNCGAKMDLGDDE